MPRITISIPTELKEQLGNRRVRQAINLSRICQDALRREVRRLLDIPTDLGRMNQLIERLRHECEDSSDHWFLLGSVDARSWIENQSTLAKLRELGEMKHQSRLNSLRGNPPAGLRDALAKHRSEAEFNTNSYLEGWAATIAPMWETIKRHL